MVWETIEEFPRYSINEQGEVHDSKYNTIVNQHMVTGGALAVRLRSDQDGLFYTRSVKVLVARHFVEYDFDPNEVSIVEFDTPILLDNNAENLYFENIRWRPRWFAWEYKHQFKDNKADWHFEGPIRNYQTNEIFSDVITVGVRYGLLFKDIYNAANEFEDGIPSDDYLGAPNECPRPLFPTRGSFGWHR